MLGLLYKDYTAVKGRYFLMAFLGQFVLISGIRFLIVDEVTDSILMLVVPVILCCFAGSIPFTFETSLMKADQGRKQKQYFLSLPVSRRQYVKSKYIFLAIAFYIVQAVGSFEFIVCQVNMESEKMAANITSSQLLVLVFISVCLIVCAFELPFLIGMGVRKGRAAKEVLFFAFFFLVVTYIMFGDLSIFDTAGLVELVEYLTSHPEISVAVQVIMPVAGILSFCVSYRVSACIFERKEWEDE